MGLPPRPMFFHLIILIGCCFCFGRAIDCGGKQIAQTIIVDQQGKGAFKNIQPAIDSVKMNNDRWIKIHINPGTYVESIYIPDGKPCIILEGSDRRTTKITYGDSKATFAFFSKPPNMVFSGITFENTYGTKGPAVAAKFNGDKIAIFNCNFLGYQDTLFDASGIHYYKNCYIRGEVDFIWGESRSFFENCVIDARQDVSKPTGFITAQRRNSSNDQVGFVFYGGKIIGVGKVLLGRAYGPYSRVIFWKTDISSVVLPLGWDPWKYKGHENNFVYAEVDCTGPGANTQGRVKWEKKPNEININEYSLQSFINQDGWLSNLPPISM
ncbi:unnamed protein product [Lathyrus oleraceus]